MAYTAINSGLLVLIWLVQIIIYPGMHGWDKARFAELHGDYTRRITFIVVPLMLGQAALVLHRVVVVPSKTAILQALLIAVVWGVTIFVSVPLHRRLGAGYDRQAVTRLVNTNWVRTAGWSLVSLVDLLG